MSYKSNICNEFMFFYEISLYSFNYFIKTKNNNLDFDKFIMDYEVINHISSQDVYKKFSDIRDFLCLYDADEYIIKQIAEKSHEKFQTSSPHICILSIKINVRRNNNERDKNDRPYAHLNISEAINATINIPSHFLLAEFANSNWHISFMNMMEKSILQVYSTMITIITLSISKAFKYLKSL